MIRHAISPRFAMRTFSNTSAGSGVGDNDADRRWIEPVAGIVDLRAVTDQRQDVTRSSAGDVQPRCGDPVDDSHRAIRLDRDVHEPVDVAHEVAFAETPFGGFEKEVLDAGMLM